MRIIYIPKRSTVSEIKYGRIYKGYIVNDSRGFCPTGWSFPTLAQIDALRVFLDPTGSITTNIAGRHLKIAGTDFWVSGNDADNSTLFSGKGSGSLEFNGNYINFQNQVNFWGQTAVDTRRRCLNLNTSSSMLRPLFEVTTGQCVRLIKNDSTDTGTMTGNDGTVYKTVTIGTQVWMAENSKETLFLNGESIPIVTNATDFAASSVSCMASPNYDDSLI